MAIRIIGSAFWHSVTEEEIREVVEYPLVRYRGSSRKWPNAVIYRYIGDPSVVIEALAEEVGDDIVVFHAMVLTMRVAEECFVHSGETHDYRGSVAAQREYQGP